MIDALRHSARSVVPTRQRQRIADVVLPWLFRQQQGRLYQAHTGALRSSRGMGRFARQVARGHFQHREKAECALAAATSWYGGDYMEFGACGLFTFRDMLTAYHLADLDERFPATRFYAFDVFGDLSSCNAALQSEMAAFDARTSYFTQQFPEGDDYSRHVDLLKRHGLYVDRCEMVKGFFEDTLTAERKAAYQPRQIGYAFIDCNFEEPYRVVFRWIFDLMAPNSYVYMDEYFQASGVAADFEQFRRALSEQRGITCTYVRPAGAFGALFRLAPISARPPLFG